MINLGEEHIKILTKRMSDRDDSRPLEIIFWTASKEHAVGLHRSTIQRIVLGKPLSDPTVKKLLVLLRHLGLDEFADTNWLENVTPTANGKKHSLATYVDPHLDANVQYQHEIKKIVGYYAVYRRVSSSGTQTVSSGALIRELMYIVDSDGSTTECYFVTKKGAVYKGAALRSRDIWKFEFYRVYEQLTTISRTLALQVNNPAIRRKIFGGVLTRATDDHYDAAASDVVAVALPKSDWLHSQGSRIVEAYVKGERLYKPEDEDIPETVLRTDKIKPEERKIYDMLTGTIISPDDTALSKLVLDEVYGELPLK